VAAALAVGVLAVRTGQLEQERDAETVQAQNLTELVREIGEPGTRYALLNDQTTGAPLAAVVLDDGERRVYPVGLAPNGDDALYVAWGLPESGPPVPLGGFDVPASEQGPVPVGSVRVLRTSRSTPSPSSPVATSRTPRPRWSRAGR
jgi:hypothetical protein